MAPHASAIATTPTIRVPRSIVATRVISCGAVLKRHTLPKLVLAQPSHTSQRRREHTQSAHRVSNLCRPWPQPRSSVLRHHSGCKEHASFEFERLRRSPPLPAALQRRLTSSPCCPRPRRSFSPWLTACGRRVSSLGIIRWRWGGLLTLPLHPPGTCTAEEPMQTSQHRQQTGCRSSPACRSNGCTACDTLLSSRATAPQTLSSSKRPPEVRRAHGRTRRAPSLARRSHVAKLCVKGLNLVSLNFSVF